MKILAYFNQDHVYLALLLALGNKLEEKLSSRQSDTQDIGNQTVALAKASHRV